MMRANILLLLFLSSCSLTEYEKRFLENIEGVYCSGTDDQFIIRQKDKGNFKLKGINYTLLTIISETNATYKLDDVQYMGIYYSPAKDGKMRLTFINSTDATEEGIKTDITSAALSQLAYKE